MARSAPHGSPREPTGRRGSTGRGRARARTGRGKPRSASGGCSTPTANRTARGGAGPAEEDLQRGPAEEDLQGATGGFVTRCSHAPDLKETVEQGTPGARRARGESAGDGLPAGAVVRRRGRAAPGRRALPRTAAHSAAPEVGAAPETLAEVLRPGRKDGRLLLGIARQKASPRLLDRGQYLHSRTDVSLNVGARRRAGRDARPFARSVLLGAAS